MHTTTSQLGPETSVILNNFIDDPINQITNNMSYPMRDLCNEVETLAADAGVLMDSTTNAACKRYEEARQGIAAVSDRGKEIYSKASKRYAKVIKTADKAMHNNPYQAILISIGVGSLLGYLIAHTSGCSSD